MSITDPIADMLTVIRNAQQARKETVDFPASKIKEQILNILKNEGYIIDYRRAADGRQGMIRVYLRYAKDKSGIITGLKRVSTPGHHRHVKSERIPYVYGGTGIAVLSTSRGIMTDKEARRRRIGGEIICYVW